MQRNKFDRKGNLEDGINAENHFLRLARLNGWTTEKSQGDDDINSHWDIIISNNKEKYRVDVKAIKRISRSDSQKQDAYHWVELHGVRPYDKGWLYGGKADLIAFETQKGFVIVERIRLIEWINRKVDFSKVVSNSREAVYKIYTRSGRPDRITLVPTEDLVQIAKWIWYKEKINE